MWFSFTYHNFSKLIFLLNFLFCCFSQHLLISSVLCLFNNEGECDGYVCKFNLDYCCIIYLLQGENVETFPDVPSTTRVDYFMPQVKEWFGIDSKVGCSLKLGTVELKSKESLGDQSVKSGSLLVLVSSGKVRSNKVAPENLVNFNVQFVGFFWLFF
jgi:hypothetical protein